MVHINQPSRRQPPPLRTLLLQGELSYLLLVLIAAGVGVWWALQARAAWTESRRLAAVTQSAESLRGDVYQQLRAATRAELTEQAESLVDFGRLADGIAARFDALDAVVGHADERVALDYLRQTYDALRDDMSRISTGPLSSGAVREPMRLLDPAYERWLLEDFESGLSVLGGVIARERGALEARVVRRDGRMLAVVVTLLGIGLSVLLASRARLRRRFVAPMLTLRERAARLSAGEYEVVEQAAAVGGVAEVAALDTALRAAAGEVRRGREQLARRERDAALGALVPVVAHNVRNPLASIRALAQLMDDEATADEVAESRTGILGTVDRLERWTSALLRYLHPDSAVRSTCALAEVVDGAVESLAGRVAEMGVTMQVDVPPGIQATLDADLVEQAIAGLLGNALDASHAGGEVRVGVSAEGDTATITIDDDGPGIAFEPTFHDLVPGPSTKQYGTGLGLPFAAKVANTHGGDLRVFRREAGGTRARMTLARSSA